MAPQLRLKSTNFPCSFLQLLSCKSKWHSPQMHPHHRFSKSANKMFFEFNPSYDLSTPTLSHDGVEKINPILTSTDISSHDDFEMFFASLSTKKASSDIAPNENINDPIHQEDLLSSFDFPVLSELDTIDPLHLEKYTIESTAPSSPGDDSTSVGLPWVGEECTVDSMTGEDMIVPPSPSLSLTSASPMSTSSKRSIKKAGFSITERKFRKKEQNKTAAEKYRLKKRSERTELFDRHADVKKQNQELKFELENLNFRLEQMKQLFVDVLQIPIPPTQS